jgi:hypothetical protein
MFFFEEDLYFKKPDRQVFCPLYLTNLGHCQEERKQHEKLHNYSAITQEDHFTLHPPKNQ